MNLWEKKKLIAVVVLAVVLAALSIWQSTPGKLLEGGVIQGGEQLAESKNQSLQRCTSAGK